MKFRSDEQRKAVFANMFSGSKTKLSRVDSSSVRNMEVKSKTKVQNVKLPQSSRFRNQKITLKDVKKIEEQSVSCRMCRRKGFSLSKDVCKECKEEIKIEKKKQERLERETLEIYRNLERKIKSKNAVELDDFHLVETREFWNLSADQRNKLLVSYNKAFIKKFEKTFKPWSPRPKFYSYSLSYIPRVSFYSERYDESDYDRLEEFIPLDSEEISLRGFNWAIDEQNFPHTLNQQKNFTIKDAIENKIKFSKQVKIQNHGDGPYEAVYYSGVVK